MKTEIVLRPYQSDSINQTRNALLAGKPKPLIQLPTGGGKTIVALDIIKGKLSKGKKVLFLAPRRYVPFRLPVSIRLVLVTCGDCGSVFMSWRDCPMCGHEIIPPTESIPTYAADLVEVVVVESKAWNRKTEWSAKIQFYSELQGYSANNGYLKHWCSHQYRAQTGVWTNDQRLKAATSSKPSAELLGWIKHQAIKRKVAA